jgi:hypothetical protein
MTEIETQDKKPTQVTEFIDFNLKIAFYPISVQARTHQG